MKQIKQNMIIDSVLNMFGQGQQMTGKVVGLYRDWIWKAQLHMIVDMILQPRAQEHFIKLLLVNTVNLQINVLI